MPSAPNTIHTAHHSGTWTGVLQAAMNLMIIALFMFLAIASYGRFVHTGSIQAFGVLAVNTLFLILFVTRKPASAESASVALWLLAFGTTALPLLLRPTEASPYLRLGSVVQLVGLTLLTGALFSLRRSFGIVPANRGIRDGGLYRLVRHPVYLSELTLMLGVVLANPSAVNAGIWICACVLQLARARAEETFLSADSLYAAYCARVRHRLIPGLV